MYGMNYSGGHNRTHGQVEGAWRIDSFDAAISEGDCKLFACAGEKVHLLDLDHFMECWPTQETDQEFVEVWNGNWGQTLELTRTPSSFGGHCTFWVCPNCGKRVRFFYFKNLGFACRTCCKLNYAVQQ